MKPILPDDLTYVGFVSKPHGFKGEVLIALETTDADQLEGIKYLFILLEGLPVPYRIDSSRLKSGNLLIHFEDISKEEDARALTGKQVYAEKHLIEESETEDFTELNGYTAIDSAAGLIGVIEGIDEYPMQLIARCDFRGKEILFPLNETIVQAIDHDLKTVTIRLPDGLLDVYLT